MLKNGSKETTKAISEKYSLGLFYHLYSRCNNVLYLREAPEEEEH